VTSGSLKAEGDGEKGSTSDPWLAEDATGLFHTLQPRLLCMLFRLES